MYTAQKMKNEGIHTIAQKEGLNKTKTKKEQKI